MLVFRACGVRQNLYVFSLYLNPDLDDPIFDCLLASMAVVQVELFCLCVIQMPIIGSLTVMKSQTLTSQLSPVAISWMSA